MISFNRIIALTVTVGALAGSPASAQAVASKPRTVVLLASAATEGKPSTVASGVFFSTTLAVEIGDGAVLLSASADGSGKLRTDDEAILAVQHADGKVDQWMQDYRDPASGVIKSIDVQDVSLLFAHGINTVTLMLLDLTPPAHSTSAYYLVFNAPEKAGMPVAATPFLATPTPFRSTVVTQLATRMISVSPVVETVSPSATPAITNTVSTTGRAAGQTGATNDEKPSTLVALPWVLVFTTLVILAVVIFLLRRRQTRVQTGALYGIVNLSYVATKERCDRVDLTQFSGAVGIYINPLCLVQVRKQEVPLAVLMKGVDGMTCRIMAVDSEKVITLHDRDEIKLGPNGQVTLNFRAPASANMMTHTATTIP